MKVSGIIWLRDIVDKLEWKHDVTTEAVEEVLMNARHFRRIEAGKIEGENLYTASGQTEAGRYLIVYFIHKTTDEALVISARTMTKQERRSYGKR
jgi:hypothetical protein